MAKQTQRFYRYQHQTRGWSTFEVRYRETDLWIRAQKILQEQAREAVLNCRHQIEQYIARFPEFLHSLHPLPDDPLAPPIVRQMLQAALKAGVGPMASVAGAIAQFVANALKPWTSTIIVENGGDCYLDVQEEITTGIYAGPSSPFTDRLALRFAPKRFPLGICTSSGTIGHSFSSGKADVVTVVSKDCALSDAAATALANLVQSSSSIETALEKAPQVPGIEGCLILIKDKMGIWGQLEVIPL
jgi:ApbE superfamily uncharacterized protein (UPF0280 family)